jgi:hypothetical protein
MRAHSSSELDPLWAKSRQDKKRKKNSRQDSLFQLDNSRTKPRRIKAVQYRGKSFLP